jgi:hypothetical protein
MFNSFGRLALGKKTTSVVIVDDCDNTWRCIAVYGTRPNAHIKIGGSWGRLVDARRLAIGVKIKVGVPSAGKNGTVFMTIKRPNVFQDLCLVFLHLCFNCFLNECLCFMLFPLVLCPHFPIKCRISSFKLVSSMDVVQSIVTCYFNSMNMLSLCSNHCIFIKYVYRSCLLIFICLNCYYQPYN